MKNMMKFAFRNVFRNKKRTLLTAVTIFIATVVVAFAQGYINGYMDMFLRNFVNYQTGNYKITTEKFVKRERFLPVDEIIGSSGGIASGISKIKGVSHTEQRLRFGIILGNEENSVPVTGVGIDLKNSAFRLPSVLIEGAVEDSGIYIGWELAQKLSVKMGDDLLLAAKTSEGGLNGIKLKIKGILKFGIMVFDREYFFISLSDARKLLKTGEGAAEILVYTGKEASHEKLMMEMEKVIGQFPSETALKIRTPEEQLGGYYEIMEGSKFIYYIIEFLILFLASFVVTNTMMMAVFERIDEIGTLKAMGMTDRELFFNFTWEGVFIGSLGGVAGGIIGYLIVLYYSTVGFNLQKAMEGFTLPANYIVYPYIGPDVLFVTIAMAVIITAVSAMLPARYVKKLTPAEALRKV